ncbi:PREDICTED: uncharacterized protein LOC104610664 [Nelumbo nucifera]|uniref:Uncharacterized protein LOC104610664 n=1 Tax=Nelumbo nucifera TaxID=4432 RepID=A0A1U8B4E8_NELNU|nr:PREDICTED: uncharacterized protein LOC104610664 [Nelumbo nucifera]
MVANIPKDVIEFLKLADQFIGIEEEINQKSENPPEKRKREGEASTNGDNKRKKDEPARGGGKSDQSFRAPPVERKNYMPLNAKRTEILMAIKDASYVKLPPRMRGDPNTRNRNVYYHFHRDHCHSTKNCKNLRDEIEELIRHGYLKNFVLSDNKNQTGRQGEQGGDAPESNNRKNEQPQRQLPEERPVRGVIHMITGGSIVVGCTSTAVKTSACEIEREEQNPPKKPRLEEPIFFTEDDARGIQYPHDDALFIKIRINDFEVKCVLVDSGSSANILFKDAFDKLQLQESEIKPVNIPLKIQTGLSKSAHRLRSLYVLSW